MHHKNRLSSAARWVTVALAVFPLAAYALGLGKLTVRSALNEPLNAEIEISSIADKELKGLQVGLAPRADFDQAGIEYLPFLGDVKFTVSKRAEGNYFIQLRTDRQIEEPFLHMLLAVEWPGGRMVREYTALIDPPVQALGKPSGIDVPAAAPVITGAQVPVPAKPEPAATEEPTPAPAVTEKPEIQPAPAATDTAATQPPASAPTMATSPSVEMKPAEMSPAPAATAPRTPASSIPSTASGWSADGGYQVKWGDTAWRIAEQLRANDSQTIEQLVLALYRTNPQAFFGNNINNLRSGQILKIPEGTQIESITPVQARTEFRAQYDAWQEYKIKLAGASSGIKVVDNEAKPSVAAAPPKEETVAKKEPEAKKEQDKLAKTPAQKSAQQDELLKIVRSTLQGEKTTPDKKPVEGEAPKDRGAKEQQALADRVTTLEESLASKQNETKDIGDKVAQVRAQLKREARLIQIEQQQLANTQNKGKPAESAPKVEAPKTEPAPVPKIESTPTPKAEASKPVEKPVPAPTPAPAVVPEKPPAEASPKPPVAIAPPSVEEKGFLDDLMENLLSGDSVLPVLIGVIALVSVGIGFVYMKRRRKSIAEFEESILQSEGIPGTTGEPNLTTDTSGQVVSSGDTSFLSDFSQGGMGNIHTDEVDPIAEAEVYLAYGRDETAEEILKEAIVKNPAREELKLKLLEIYANRSDVRAFETLAEEMYAAMGGRPSKNWPRVEDLGRKLNPNNPMFKGGGAVSALTAKPAAAAPNFSDTAKMKAVAPAAPNTAMLSDTQHGAASGMQTAAASDLNFDLGAAAPAASDSGLDFDIGSSARTKTAVAEPLDFESAIGSSSSDGGIDMDLGHSPDNAVDFDFGEKEEIATAAPQTDTAFDVTPSTAVANGDAATESPQWDETATKLDLARAYIDMGDAEGARSILDEVMSEGNDQQKKQAKELSAQLA